MNDLLCHVTKRYQYITLTFLEVMIMKHILFLALVGTIVSGCVKPPAPNQETSRIVNSENGKDIRKWMGAVSFRMAKDGVREVVLRAKNNTKNNLWVPASSGGVRGMSGAEAVNLTEMDPKSMKSLHVDFSRCKFPDQYEMVKPGQSWEYIHKLPNDFRGDIKISVWAPWRTDQGIFVTKETKMAALKNGDLLIEEVEGIGHFEEEDLLQDKSSVRDKQPADLQR